MKIVQMDRLDFSDHFSYIIYLIWSYGWFSMIFRSFNYFLKFSELYLIQKMSYGVSTTSLWRQQVNWPGPGQTWRVGSTRQWHS